MAFKRDKYTGEAINDDDADFSKAVQAAYASAQAGDVQDYQQQRNMKQFENDLAKPATDSEIALRKSQASNFSADAEGKGIENNILLKTGLRKAEAITGDLENAASVNKDFRRPAAAVALEGAQADVGFTKERTKNYKDEIKLARVNQGNTLFLESDQINKSTSAKQKETEDTWKNRASVNPAFMGGAETRNYIKEVETDLGTYSTPQGIIERTKDKLPFAQYRKALQTKQKAQSFLDRTIAKP